MKKIDENILYLGLLQIFISTFLLFLSLKNESLNYLKFEETLSLSFGLIIFYIFYKDEYFKFKYYLGFVFLRTFFNSFGKVFLELFPAEKYTLTFSTALAILISIIIAFINAYFYKMFREMSYIKNRFQ